MCAGANGFWRDFGRWQRNQRATRTSNKTPIHKPHKRLQPHTHNHPIAHPSPTCLRSPHFGSPGESRNISSLVNASLGTTAEPIDEMRLNCRATHHSAAAKMKRDTALRLCPKLSDGLHELDMIRHEHNGARVSRDRLIGTGRSSDVKFAIRSLEPGRPVRWPRVPERTSPDRSAGSSSSFRPRSSSCRCRPRCGP